MNACGASCTISRTTCVGYVSADMYPAGCSFLRRNYRSKREALRYRERQQKMRSSQQKDEKQRPEWKNQQSLSSSPQVSSATVDSHMKPKPSPLTANAVPATQPPANGPVHFTSSSGSCACEPTFASASEARQGFGFHFALASAPTFCAFESGNLQAYEYGLVQQPQPQLLQQRQWVSLCYSPVVLQAQQYSYSQWPPAAQSRGDLHSLSSSTTWPLAHYM